MLARIVAGRTDLVLDHLSAGRAATACDADGVPLVRWCAYYGDVTAVRLLVQGGARLEDLGENFDLSGAAFHGHWRLCEYLLESGADVDHADRETGETALHAAVSKPHRPTYELVVGVLLSHGASPDRATIPDRVTDAFLRDCRTKGETPLHRAAAFASEETIRRLLEVGARRDARDAAGDTPLSWASWHARPDGISRLLCFEPHRLHPDRRATGEHGSGWGTLEISLLGHPHP